MAQSRPRVVVHASISADGCMTGFLPDLAAHYAAAAEIPAQARLIGSATLASGLDADGAAAQAAEPGPRPDDPSLPIWAVVDSTGRLHGRLGAVRAFPPVRDVVVLVSRATPDSYLQYLARNRYRYLMCGDSRVDLACALRQLAAAFPIEQVMVDAGPTLVSVLLDAGLVDELSLLLHPVVVGREGHRLFAHANRGAGLVLRAEPEQRGGAVRLRYGIEAAVRA